jgi:hypothetical protein
MWRAIRDQLNNEIFSPLWYELEDRNFTQGNVLETVYTWKARIFTANALLWEEIENDY